MIAVAFVLSARTRIERLFDALVHPARRERTMLVVLACYFAIWSLYAAISQSSQDIHTDMGEYIAWSREVGLGTLKHPPLGAWLMRAWFSVFPREDWAYYCFAILLPTLAEKPNIPCKGYIFHDISRHGLAGRISSRLRARVPCVSGAGSG
jgi:hypothetical protein